jgi:hypothetical protein
MVTRKIFALGMVFLMSIPLAACGNQIQATDYSKPEHWLSVPAAADKAVDVFYLYPTSWMKVNPGDPNICDIDNPLMLKYSCPAAPGDRLWNFRKYLRALLPAG